jgi:hypothetical protein
MKEKFYQVGLSIAHGLRGAAQDEHERSAVQRLENFSATADDVKLAIVICRRDGNAPHAEFLAEMLPETRSPKSREPLWPSLSSVPPETDST